MYRTSMSLMKRYRMLSKIYRDYTSIEHSRELCRRGLTLAEYRAFPELFKSVQSNNGTATFIKGIADYFAKFGFRVELGADGVSYEITFPN